MKARTFYSRILSLFVVLFALTGCETTTKRSKTPPPAAFTVKRGDSVMTLIEQMGEPDRKSSIEKSGATGAIWTYQDKMRSKIRMVPDGTRQVAVYDRNTEQTIMVSEPTFTQESSSLDQITEFLIMDGKVISWKQRIDDDKIRIE
ncbi:MAG: hypothetical protein HOH58_06905 [Opitutaceae bacterium]|nr:hypothetical protein [Opitutaceae bacterium]